MYKIRISKESGFCFGVKRATEAVENAIDDGTSELYTLGKLIHNKSYNDYLKSNNVKEIASTDIPSIIGKAKEGHKITIFIRAHGEKKEILDKLEDAQKEIPDLVVSDCTCPYVRKVREIARDNSGECKLFILIGSHEHPEVQGIMSCTSGDGLVFSSADELQEWLCSDSAIKYKNYIISMASQTTQNCAEWQKCQEFAKKVYTKIKIFDTICNVTEIRQFEASLLADKADEVLVIGSKDSSNTRKLYEICSKKCKSTYLIENALDLRGIPLPPVGTDGNALISITAGASTPISVIQEVQLKMDENNNTNENFEEMLEDSLKTTLKPGEIVTGVITSVTPNEVYVDVGTKTTGVISKDKLTTDTSAELSDLFKPGDKVRAKVIKVSDIDGMTSLDKLRADSCLNLDKMSEYADTNETVEGKIVEVVKGGLIALVDGVRVFVPASLSGVSRDAGSNALSVLVGTTQKMKIIESNIQKKRILGSIRAAAREERKEKEKKFWDEAEVGKVYEGPVKSITSYGAFVDLGGVDGMVHVSELSWQRHAKPSDIVSVGQAIKVYVKDLDREKGRISLGYKNEDDNPWKIFSEKFKLGDVANVKIVSILKFGAFAQIVPGVDGLIHISQITDHKIESPAEVLHVGDTVDAKIISIDEENQKVNLSIKALMEPEEKEVSDEDKSSDAPDEGSDDAITYSTDDPKPFDQTSEDVDAKD